MQPVLDLVPERGMGERALDPFVEPRAHAQVAGRPGDVVVDRLREWVGLLKDHSDPAADLDAVGRLGVDVMAVIQHTALQPKARNRVIHPVETSDERRLAASGRPDYSRDQMAV